MSQKPTPTEQVTSYLDDLGTDFVAAAMHVAERLTECGDMIASIRHLVCPACVPKVDALVASFARELPELGA